MNLIEETKIYSDGVVDTVKLVREKYENLSDEDFTDWLIDYLYNAEKLQTILKSICDQEGSENE